MTAVIAIAWGLLVFSVIILLLYPYGTSYDMLRRRVDNVLSDTKKLYLIDDELSKPLSERFVKPVIKALALKLQNYTGKNGSKRQRNEKLKKMLHQAGFNVSPMEYSIIQTVVIAGSAVAFWLISILLGLGIKSIFGALLGTYAGYAVMRFWLTAAISGRRKLIEQQLPDVLDMLSVNVEAGLGFEQAILQVIGHFEGPLIDELTITYREMTMGRTRRDALDLFAQRCELNEIKTFSGAIVQAEQLGISIKNVLRTQAAAMRTSRRNKVEEKAMKISVKILLPMVGFIFPVLFIVLMGPAAVKIIDQFK